MKFSKTIFSLALFITLATSFSALAQQVYVQKYFVKIDPKGTYLYYDSENDVADPPTTFSLVPLYADPLVNLKAGDLIAYLRVTVRVKAHMLPSTYRTQNLSAHLKPQHIKKLHIHTSGNIKNLKRKVGLFRAKLTITTTPMQVCNSTLFKTLKTHKVLILITTVMVLSLKSAISH